MNKVQMAYNAGWKAALAGMKSDETVNFRPLDGGTAVAIEVKNPKIFQAIADSNGANEYNNGVWFFDAYWPGMISSLERQGILPEGDFAQAVDGKPYIVVFVRK